MKELLFKALSDGTSNDVSLRKRLDSCSEEQLELALQMLENGHSTIQILKVL